MNSGSGSSNCARKDLSFSRAKFISLTALGARIEVKNRFDLRAGDALLTRRGDMDFTYGGLGLTLSHYMILGELFYGLLSGL